MKKKNGKVFLTVLLVCTVALSMTVTAGAASFAEIDTSGWGSTHRVMCQDGRERTYYVDESGRYSAMIGDDPVTWLYVETVEEHDGQVAPISTGCWFGISNSIKMDGNPLFEKGSRFSVTFVGRDNDLKKWDEYYNNYLDTEARGKFNRKTKFCDISVTRPDGCEYTNLGDLAELFTSADIMLFEGGSEQIVHVIKTLPINGIECPVSGKYAVFLLDHLGEPYIGDVSDYWSGSVIADTITPVSVLIIGAAALAVGLIVGFLVGKKRSAIIKKSEPTGEE